MSSIIPRALEDSFTFKALAQLVSNSLNGSIGLFSTAADQIVAETSQVIQTTGFTTAGIGSCFYIFDATVDNAYVTSHPASSFITKNGRGFRVLKGQDVDVFKFGAVGDGITNDTAAVQAAYDTLVLLGGGTLHIPPGNFKCNLVANSRNVNVVGQNQQKSVLSPDDKTKPVLTINLPDGSTAYPFFSNFAVENQITYDNNSKIIESSLASTGIQFGTTSYQPYTEYSGRVNFNCLRIRGFTKGVNRPWGNIVVKFDDCELRENGYHFFNLGKPFGTDGTHPNNGDLMHSGCLTVRGGVWIGSLYSSFYMKSYTVGTGQVTIDNVVIDSNPSYIFYVEGFSSTDGQPGFVIRQCWNEEDADLNARFAPNYKVTIDGNGPKSPIWGHFKDCQGIKIVDTPVGSLELINTVVVTESCSIDRMRSLNADLDSALYHDNAKGFGGRPTFGVFRSITEPNESARGGPNAQWYRRPLITQTTRAYASAVKRGYDGNTPIPFTGSRVSSTTDILGGGVLSGSTKTQKLSFITGDTLITTPVSVDARSYILIAYTYRKLSGPDIQIQITGYEGLSVPYMLSSTEWETVVCLARNETAFNDLALYHFSGNANSEIEIGGISIVGFNTKQKALNCLNSGVIPLP